MEELRSLLDDVRLEREQLIRVCDELQGPQSSLALAVLARQLLTQSKEVHRDLSDLITSSLDGTNASRAFNALSAVFQIDHDLGIEFCKAEGMDLRLSDALELLSEPSETSARPALARFLAVSSGFGAMHALVKQIHGLQWAQREQQRSANDVAVRLPAAVAVIKLSRAVDDNLLDYILPFCFESGQNQVDALQGLAVASMRSSVKRKLVSRPDILRKLCALIAKRPSPDPALEVEYSMAATLAHLLAYPPVLSEEQKMYEKMAKLKMKAEGADDEEAETRIECDQRNDVLLKAGAAPALVRLARSSSTAARVMASKGLLALAEKPQRRGLLLQAGASKVLLTRAGATKADDFDLPAAQALAKLLITSNPSIALNAPSMLLDALSVLVRLLMHSDSTSLSHFEAMMALTNVSSLSAELADRLASIPQLLDAVDGYMLESEPPLRCRAATELACNLAGTAAAKTKWSDKRSATLFLALARSAEEDEALSLAASGALARLGSALANAVLGDEKLCKRVCELIEDDASEELVMRGLVFIGELAVSNPSKARESDFVSALQHIISGTHRSQDIRETAIQVVKAIES